MGVGRLIYQEATQIPNSSTIARLWGFCAASEFSRTKVDRFVSFALLLRLRIAGAFYFGSKMRAKRECRHMAG